jgi:hypothetical protein
MYQAGVLAFAPTVRQYFPRGAPARHTSRSFTTIKEFSVRSPLVRQQLRPIVDQPRRHLDFAVFPMPAGANLANSSSQQMFVRVRLVFSAVPLSPLSRPACCLERTPNQ